MTYSGKRFRIVCFFGHGVNDLYWFILPLVLPLMLKTFGLSYGKAGGILTVYLLVIAILSFLFGKLSDRSSRWILLGPGFFAASAGLILSGFMPNLAFLVLCLGITGIGVSTFHPLMYATIDERTRVKRGDAFGKYEFWGSTAIFIMFVVNGTLLRIIGWKQILILTALPGVAAGIIYSIGKPEPMAIGKEEDEAISGSTPGLPSGVFILFLLSILLRILGTTATMNFIPTYLVAEVGIDNSIATYASGLLFFGGMIASILAGKSADRWGAFPILVTAILVIIPSIFVLTLKVPLWVYGVSIFLFGAGVSAGLPAQNMVAFSLSKGMGGGEVFGIITAMMTLIAAVNPVLLGMLADRTGLGNAFRVFAIPLAASLIITIILMRSRKLKRNSHIHSNRHTRPPHRG